ncbi:MAG TPA: hypothetical protein PL009_04280 [Flavipsychrobacter sp.]|nr:hypothetical protein [Flavipsychrobacter sp.]
MKQIIKLFFGFFFLIGLLANTAIAQNKRGDRVHALKVNYITQKINLRATQSDQFWTTYNSYEKELRSLRQSFLKSYKKQQNNFSEQEARKYIEDNLDYQDAVVDLKRKYKNEFLKVISAQQLTDLYIAEREFRQMLIQKLREKRAKRQH